MNVAATHFARSLRISFGNLIPGLTHFVKAAAPEPLHGIAAFVAMLQSWLGWALLALIAHRFFKGLKR